MENEKMAWGIAVVAMMFAVAGLVLPSADAANFENRQVDNYRMWTGAAGWYSIENLTFTLDSRCAVHITADGDIGNENWGLLKTQLRLTLDGTPVANENFLVNSNNPFDRYLITTAFGTAGGTVAGGGGYYTNNEFDLRMNTGGTENGWAWHLMNLGAARLDRNFEVEFSANIEAYDDDQEGYFESGFFVGQGAVGGAHRFTENVYPFGNNGIGNYAGFYMANTPTYPFHIFAYSHSIISVLPWWHYTITDLGTFSEDASYALKLVNRQDRLEFYVNGILKATHTTDIIWSTYFAQADVSTVADCDVDKSTHVNFFRMICDYDVPPPPVYTTFAMSHATVLDPGTYTIQVQVYLENGGNILSRNRGINVLASPA